MTERLNTAMTPQQAEDRLFVLFGSMAVPGPDLGDHAVEIRDYIAALTVELEAARGLLRGHGIGGAG